MGTCWRCGLQLAYGTSPCPRCAAAIAWAPYQPPTYNPPPTYVSQAPDFGSGLGQGMGIGIGCLLVFFALILLMFFGCASMFHSAAIVYPMTGI